MHLNRRFDAKRTTLPLAFALAILAPTGALAQSTDTGATPNPWGTQCSGQSRLGVLECSMEQQLVLQETGQFLARILIRVPSDADAPVYLIQLPLRISIPVGISLSVDEVPLSNLSFQTCDATGCFAGGTMSSQNIQAMKAGNNLTLNFDDGANRPISLDFSLQGFSKAFGDIEK